MADPGPFGQWRCARQGKEGQVQQNVDENHVKCEKFGEMYKMKRSLEGCCINQYWQEMGAHCKSAVT